jgi:AcrR family transcriptional regulator
MKTTAQARTRGERLTAEERREAVLDAAIAEFSAYGLHGASTEAIARRAGISQPYVFRLFGTKQELFLEAAERVFDRIMATFRAAAEAGGGENLLETMGESFVLLLRQREELLMLLQAFAASADEEVQREVRRRFAEVYEYVADTSGAGDDEVRDFVAHGMLLIVAAALDLPTAMQKEDWARRCLGLRPD